MQEHRKNNNFKVRISPFRSKSKEKWFHVCGWMLCDAGKQGKGTASSPDLSTLGILGVVDRISYAGCSIQWQGEQWKHTMYTYPESDLIYIGIPNQYGYRYNINHPVVAVYYQRYKEKHHLHRCFPLSDKQRWEFERGMDRLLLNGRHRPEEIFR